MDGRAETKNGRQRGPATPYRNRRASSWRLAPSPPLDRALVERSPGETRIALMAAGHLWELYHFRDHHVMAGDIILGRVRAKTPDGTAVFVDIGAPQDGFLAGEDCVSGAGRLPPEGAAVLVDVTRAPQAEKGAKLTMAVSLPDTLMTYTPFRPGLRLSAKITAHAECQKLTDWAARNLGAEEGIVVRTRARNSDDKALDQALQAARRHWAELCARLAHEKPPQRLLRAAQTPGGALAVALNGRSVERAICVGANAWETTRSLDLAKVVMQAHHGQALFTQEGVDDAVEEALCPRCGPLMIEQTAAVTTIDVDSGRLSAEEANAAAIPLIARQIRLRNLAGMIVIDFAAPRKGSRDHKRALAAALADALQTDPLAPQVLGVSALGLVEIRRPRRGPPLADRLLAPRYGGALCPPLAPEGSAFEVLRAILRAVAAQPSLLPQASVAAPVADCLRGPLRGALHDLEAHLGDRLPLLGVPGQEVGWYDIQDRRKQS